MPSKRVNVLLSWIGETDLRASEGDRAAGNGPILNALANRSFSHAVLLSNYTESRVKQYLSWLQDETSALIELYPAFLTSPVEYGEIYKQELAAVEYAKRTYGVSGNQLTYHLSPGTPAMAAVWIIIAKSSHPAILIDSSKKDGVRTVAIPFEISADFIPDLLRQTDADLLRLTQGLPPESSDFSEIIGTCEAMKQAKTMARRFALHDVPVLILGETGTGKELFAKAIHKSSSRQKGSFVAINCGAIPEQLLESELFGYEKGAFTGAVNASPGRIEQANGGTLFLDEIGDLALSAQVKLLRVLQEKKVTRLNGKREIPVDFRLLSATHRDLPKMILGGVFREDLYYRIAVGVLHLPPLRMRSRQDIKLLIDHILRRINQSLAGSHWQNKSISVSGKEFLFSQNWSGNVRELENILIRAAFWSTGDVIRDQDIQEAFHHGRLHSGRQIDKPASLGTTSNQRSVASDWISPDIDLNLFLPAIKDGFILTGVLAEIARHYLIKALEQTNGNKSQAAKLLGFNNYQTMDYWRKKHGV